VVLLVALLVVPHVAAPSQAASTPHTAPAVTNADSGADQATATTGTNTSGGTATPGTAGTLPTFLVNPTDTVEYCANGQWPNEIALGNTGATPLNWSASAPQGVTLTPSSGTLAAGSADSPTIQQVQISGTYTQPQLTLSFTSAAQTVAVSVTCTAL